MAFCNKCGASLNPGIRFCNQCGAAVVASSPVPNMANPAMAGSTVPSASVPAANAGQGGGALKVILIVVGVIALLGILAFGSIAFFAWRVAHRIHAHQDGNDMRVETPFGRVETTKDPADAARNLGVDLYPGAELMRNGSSTATFGGVHTATISAQSSDSVDQVFNFYKAKLPNAMVTTSDAGRSTLISNDNKSMITINVESQGGRTKIMITSVSRKSDGGNPPSN
ncbi:MAG: zinc ribbon domain-containing protein [Candidatus Sulfotelmatobacter sp.]